MTGLINQELLLKNEYLAAENRILRAQLPARLRLSDLERSTLAEIGKRLGREGAGTSRLRCQARHYSGLVREAHCQEVRWIQIPPLSRQAADRAEMGGVDRQNGERECRLGLRPNGGRTGQSRIHRLGSDGGECLEAAWHRAGAETEP